MIHIKINEIFHSIQGEGLNIGIPTVFIRFSGCNLKCIYCDTDHEDGMEMSIDKIVREVEKYSITEVCITGGEPLIQLNGLRELVKILKEGNHTITIETNGTIHDDLFNIVDLVSFDIKLPSSGMKSKLELIKRLEPKHAQIKFVIGNLEDDYQNAVQILKKEILEQKLAFPIIFMPVSEGKKEYTKNDYDLLKKLSKKVLSDNLPVRVLPQLHKILNLK